MMLGFDCGINFLNKYGIQYKNESYYFIIHTQYSHVKLKTVKHCYHDRSLLVISKWAGFRCLGPAWIFIVSSLKLQSSSSKIERDFESCLKGYATHDDTDLIYVTCMYSPQIGCHLYTSVLVTNILSPLCNTCVMVDAMFFFVIT